MEHGAELQHLLKSIPLSHLPLASLTFIIFSILFLSSPFLSSAPLVLCFLTVFSISVSVSEFSPDLNDVTARLGTCLIAYAGHQCVCLREPMFSAHPCQRPTMCFLKQQSHYINIGSR